MNKQEAKKLFEKYNSGTASREEQIQLEHWYHKEQAGQRLSEEEANFIFLKDEIWQGTLSRSGLSKPFKRVVKLWPLITAVAAIILIALSLGLYFYSDSDRTVQYVIHPVKQDIAPGGNKAILTLADGRKISLTDATNGELAQQSGIRITKSADGQLIYEVPHLEGGRTERSFPAIGMTYNTIETPKGGQYQVILPDRTKVWLNAASSLKYPASFTSLKERRVELKGEAYFEVAKAVGISPSGGGRIPFIVNTDKQVVEVLGTNFNINTYTDEPSVKTTLLEGSLKVSQLTTRNSQLLKPGQQSVLTVNGISVSEVNTEEALAWKNGYFMFESESIRTIMRKIERWYDVEVVFNGEVPTDRFGGTVSRFGNVSQVLKKLELTNRVHFKIEAMPDGRKGRRIMVSR